MKYLVTRPAREAPLCLAIEDAHWMDDETEAVLDALVESAPVSRVLILVSYRPEWRHGWASKTDYNQVHVNPLPAAGRTRCSTRSSAARPSSPRSGSS